MAIKTIGDSLNLSKWGTTDLLVSSEHFIGVEVELEGRNSSDIRNPPTLWSVVHDGSLRNGAEFIFKEPLRGSKIITALANLADFIHNAQDIEASYRCGIHVHLDVRDLNDKQLVNLLMMYILFENAIFKYVDKNRSKNPYCRPLCNSEFKHVMASLDSLNDIGEVLKTAGDSCEKYSALNIKPISTFGSVEFRMHEGTSDISNLRHWINIILALKEASITYDVRYILTLPEIDALRLVFGYTILLSKIPEVEGILEDGAATLAEVYQFSKLRSIKQSISDKTMAFKKSSKLSSAAEKYVEYFNNLNS